MTVKPNVGSAPLISPYTNMSLNLEYFIKLVTFSQHGKTKNIKSHDVATVANKTPTVLKEANVDHWLAINITICLTCDILNLCKSTNDTLNFLKD